MSSYTQYSFKIYFPVCGSQRIPFRDNFSWIPRACAFPFLLRSELRKSPEAGTSSQLQPASHSYPSTTIPLLSCFQLQFSSLPGPGHSPDLLCEFLTEGVFPEHELFHFQFAPRSFPSHFQAASITLEGVPLLPSLGRVQPTLGQAERFLLPGKA